jgi:hypothetical protein
MSDSQWNQRGGSLSLQNACKEFGLAGKDIFAALKRRLKTLGKEKAELEAG